MTTEPNDPTRSGSPLPAAGSGDVTLSRSEVESLCSKAARGAGMSWGQAEEAGFASGWLAARGIDGPSALLAHLVRAEGAAWHDLCPTVGKGRWTASGDEPLCPIAVGTALSDFADLEEGAMVGWPLVVGPVDQPLLVVPFLAEIVVRQERPARLAWDGGTVWLDASGAISGDISLLAILEVATLHLSAGSGAATEAPVTAATTTPREAIARLNALGMKTTVPPSEKSRADAGATTNDND